MKIYMIISFILSLSVSCIALPMIMKMLRNSNVLCENYKSDMIPTSVGIVFIFAQVITMGILQVLSQLQIFSQLDSGFNFVYLLGFVFMGLLGLLDDLIGDSKTKGLKGHIKAFFNGILTTGAIKAFLGFFISLVVSSYISISIKDFVINSLIIGLFTNLINIFDLRPGRATKIFIILSIIFIITSPIRNYKYILYSFFGILLPYLSLDFKAKAMMGDAGSNVLGFTLGLYAAISYSFTIRCIILLILLIIHILAENVSFSKVIENNRVLKFLDEIGR